MNPMQILHIEKRIYTIRGHKVMLDTDLADLYGVSTKRLNEQVKRNLRRFPEDFMFRLTSSEKQEVVAICDHLVHLKFSSTRPYAFTEHGALMAANILHSGRAEQMSVYVIRAFIKMRDLLATHKEIAQKLEELEKKCDAQFKTVFGVPTTEPTHRAGQTTPADLHWHKERLHFSAVTVDMKKRQPPVE
jgi:hypothetical protein